MEEQTKVAEKSEKSGFNFKKFISKLGPLVALIILIILVTALSPGFIQPSNLLNLLRQVSINAVIAFGMTFVILTGGIDLSVGSILALTGAVTASMLASGTSAIIALLVGFLMGGLLGFLNGVLIAYGKAAPFIATLATMTIFRGATYVFTNGNPITGAKMNNSFLFQFMGRGYLLGIPVPIFIMAIVYLILYVLLHKTTFGRKTYALGGNEQAAYIAGVKTKIVTMWIYTISGLMASLAGIILTSRLSSAQPDAGTSYEMDAIAAVVLGGTSLAGGKGRIFGTLIGALIIGTLNNGMNLLGISSFYQQIVKGIVILIAVLLDRRSSND
ncbi:ABC transporter permease subunit [Companilactobacillus kimchii]|uniref:Ribose xylose arabinose galactoside ABC-type transport system, permease component n=2 Tax=Companilactobacillus kimchii TaxID=2801452 RepID=A0ABR5NT06_9LACO|nr:ribose ABC transporter permease [Companilactobacillus kimchii]KAE9562080.1 ribose ABC transporter permease [Companilactobacillus kimchii]KRK51306.1 Ribose xylose arabinose galactoside ABC-type transport system, permease component [Companilactobacillus kimchii DSM 13961 = JCM 10707]OWF34213.1 Ribose transport system permease protein [Companilactobacillus kimchii]GEO46126.1 ribose ABC transporter permease [Companilactobacillus paralimentarius]